VPAPGAASAEPAAGATAYFPVMSEEPTLPDLHAHNVVIDCADHEVVLPFWSALLGWDVFRVNEQFAGIRAPAERPAAFAILFQKVPEAKVVKNRAHIDFDAGDMATEVARVVELGGSVIAERNLGDFRWTVVADPEGNEFCITIR
jgi:predicted enzyme related to lactoylglutathione lyase